MFQFLKSSNSLSPWHLMLHVSKCAPMQLLRFLKSSWKIFSTSAPSFSAGRLKFQLSRRNHKTLPPTCVACAFVVHTRYTFMIQGGGGGLPLLLPLLGENPPKMGSGHFGSMAKMEFNRFNRGRHFQKMVQPWANTIFLIPSYSTLDMVEQ